MTLNKRGGVAKWGEIISPEQFLILFICNLHLHGNAVGFLGTKNRVASGLAVDINTNST